MAHKLIKDGDLVLYGTVGGDFWSDSGFTDAEVLDALTELDGELTVRVNSGGGNAFMGIAIHNALKARDGKVTVQIDGIAASAASVIAMAGEEIVMRDGALMMIHNGSGITMGTAKDHEKTIEALTRLDGEMAKLYAKRTGLEAKETKSMMDDETWMTGEEAMSKGFATKADSEKALEAAMFDYRLYSRAPEPLRLMASTNKFKFQESGPQKTERTRFNSTATVTVAAAQGENEMDIKSLTLSALREQRPDLVTEIEKSHDMTAAIAAAKLEGAKMEAKRIADIDAVALPGHDAIIAAHKADPTKTANDCAIAQINAEKQLRAKAGDGLDADESKMKGLRSEFKPANDGADKREKPGDGLHGEAKWNAEYDASAELQAEYAKLGGKNTFLAGRRAEAAGLVRELAPARRH